MVPGTLPCDGTGRPIDGDGCKIVDGCGGVATAGGAVVGATIPDGIGLGVVAGGTGDERTAGAGAGP